MEIDRSRTKVDLPDGERDGWHRHWRRGIFGALQSWACGSLGAIVHMLAACAVHFKVEDQVCTHVHAHMLHPTPPPPPHLQLAEKLGFLSKSSL